MPEPITVPLKPVVNLSNHQYKRFEKIATAANVSVEALVKGLLKEAAEQKLKELKPLSKVFVTVRVCPRCTTRNQHATARRKNQKKYRV